MKITDAERERLADSALKVQAVRESIQHVSDDVLPKSEIEECLENVDKSFRQALGYRRREK